MLSSPGAGLVTIIRGKAIGLCHAGAALNLSSKLDVTYNKVQREPNDRMDGSTTGRLGRQGGESRAAGELLESPPWDTGWKAWRGPQGTGGYCWARRGGKLRACQEEDVHSGLALCPSRSLRGAQHCGEVRWEEKGPLTYGTDVELSSIC